MKCVFGGLEILKVCSDDSGRMSEFRLLKILLNEKRNTEMGTHVD